MPPAATPASTPPGAPAPSDVQDAGRDAVRARARRLWLRRLGRTLWLAFLALDVPLLLATVGGLAAAYLDPRPFWWVQLLGILLPYLPIPLVIAAAGPLVARRWGWLAVHLLLLAIIGWRVFPAERYGDRPAPAEDDLALMTFNVPRSGPSGDVLSDSLVAFVERTGPDVLALQDVWASAGADPLRNAIHVKAVVERLPYGLVRIPRPDRTDTDPEPIRATTVPVLVREGGPLTVIERGVVPLGNRADGDAPSMATRTRFRWGGREGVLYNVHLRSFGPQKPWEDRIHLFEPGTWLPYLRRYRDVFRARADEAEQLAEWIEAETLPVLVVGDFNGTSDNWTYHRLRGDRQDAFLVAGAGAGYTYRADKPLVRIDFVLVDTAWVVTSAAAPAVGFSDHRPLLTRLRWRDEAGAGAP